MEPVQIISGIYPKHYRIDFDKVETLEDVITILRALGPTITENVEGYVDSNFAEIKHLLVPMTKQDFIDAATGNS